MDVFIAKTAKLYPLLKTKTAVLKFADNAKSDVLYHGGVYTSINRSPRSVWGDVMTQNSVYQALFSASTFEEREPWETRLRLNRQSDALMNV